MSENPSEPGLNSIDELEEYEKLLTQKIRSAELLPDTSRNKKVIKDLKKRRIRVKEDWTPPPPGDC